MTELAPGLEQIIDPPTKDLGGGFIVRRAIPRRGARTIGPWVFFDHMGPVDLPAGRNIDVRPHPHINLATVTYLFKGEMVHADSVGSYQIIRPGDVNLMVAGTGIVHSERERPEAWEHDRHISGLQLWLGMPEEYEEIDPAFYHYPDATIPAVDVGGVPVRVMIGTAYGVTAPTKMFAETLYIEAHLKAGQSLMLPQAEKRGVYVVEGAAEVNGQALPEFNMALLETGAEITISADKEARIAMVGGEDIGPRFMDWNFVSSDKSRIDQANQDWLEQNDRFPKIPGDDKEYIPLPGSG